MRVKIQVWVLPNPFSDPGSFYFFSHQEPQFLNWELATLQALPGKPVETTELHFGGNPMP